jgi:hypothetical protein
MTDVQERIIQQPTASEIISSAASEGIYVECGQIYDNRRHRPTFYAASLDSETHQAMCVVQDLANTYHNEVLVPLNPSLPLKITVPTDRLDWARFTELPTFVQGRRTREDALKDSLGIYYLAVFFRSQEA